MAEAVIAQSRDSPAGSDPGTWLEAPTRDAVAYCPQCHRQLVDMTAVCGGCGVETKPVMEPWPPGDKVIPDEPAAGPPGETNVPPGGGGRRVPGGTTAFFGGGVWRAWIRAPQRAAGAAFHGDLQCPHGEG